MAMAEFGLNLLSHEFRLILQLLREQRLTVKDATLSSRLSSRAFYELLKRLANEGVLDIGRHPRDGRAKSIQLDGGFSARVEEHFLAISAASSPRGDRVQHAADAEQG